MKLAWFLTADCVNLLSHAQTASVIRECLQTQNVFHQHADNILSQTFSVWTLLWTVTFSCSSPHSLLTPSDAVLYSGQLQYDCVAWDSLTASYACQLERIQRKILSLLSSYFRLQLRYCPKLLEITPSRVFGRSPSYAFSNQCF